MNLVVIIINRDNIHHLVVSRRDSFPHIIVIDNSERLMISMQHYHLIIRISNKLDLFLRYHTVSVIMSFMSD